MQTLFNQLKRTESMLEKGIIHNQMNKLFGKSL